MRSIKTKILMGAGFTLLEVLLALALSSVILTALYSTFFLAQKAVGGVDDSLLRLHELRTALDVMRREMEASLENKGVTDPSLSGGANSPDRSAFRLKDRDIYGRQASEVYFTTVGSTLAGLAGVSYGVLETESGLDLVKGIRPAWSGKEAMEAPVLEDIESFTIEAKDGGSWVKTWNRPGIPEELRITIAVPSGQRSLTLSETVRPRFGSRI